jgi:uncharacterized 2Fe-2S/4Fe-4S cluster protein (DUF4445 family)
MSAQEYGIAVDIGTTNITIHLVKIENNKVLRETTLRNPQYHYGADIMTRVSHSLRNDFSRRALIDLVRDAIAKGIKEILQDIDPPTITKVVIVGNTVMHHLFFDLPVDSLSRTPYSATNKESLLVNCSEVGLDFLKNASCYSPPIVESFVGSDAIAVLIASGFLEGDDIRLTVDVGTNTEVSLVTPLGVWIASGASGPAFEGWATECGVAGEEGAISKVTIDPESYAPIITVIGDSKPSGICGTGAVSVMAALLNTNLLLTRGSFDRNKKTKWLSLEGNVVKYTLAPGSVTETGADIFVSQPDIRMLQQSKAAIRGVIEMVLKLSGRKAEDVTEVLLTGIFGSDLDVEDLYRIGMFPRFENAKISQTPNSAVDGAALLLDESNRQKVEQLLPNLNYIELTLEEDFKRLYLESMSFPSK